MNLTTADLRKSQNPAWANAVRPKFKRHPSDLESRFDRRWEDLGGPGLTKELRFDSVRMWRFDRAHLETKTAIEVEGGTWVKGAHSRGKHYQSDCEKYNAAAALGWTVFRLTTDMIEAPQLQTIIEYIRAKMI